MMSKAALTVRLLSLALAIAIPGSADGQSARGDFAASSQATIRISVSVAPRFQSPRSGSPAQSGPADASAGLTRLSSNAPALRYSVSVYPPQRAEGSQPGRASVLYLIIPD